MKSALYIVLTAVAALSIQSAWAAPGAGSKASGQFNFYGSSSRSALSSARDYSSNLRRYAEGGVGEVGGGTAMSPIVAKEAVDSIEHGVAKSEKYLAVARRQAGASARGRLGGVFLGLDRQGGEGGLIAALGMLVHGRCIAQGRAFRRDPSFST